VGCGSHKKNARVATRAPNPQPDRAMPVDTTGRFAAWEDARFTELTWVNPTAGNY